MRILVGDRVQLTNWLVAAGHWWLLRVHDRRIVGMWLRSVATILGLVRRWWWWTRIRRRLLVLIIAVRLLHQTLRVVAHFGAKQLVEHVNLGYEFVHKLIDHFLVLAVLAGERHSRIGAQLHNPVTSITGEFRDFFLAPFQLSGVCGSNRIEQKQAHSQANQKLS